MRLRLSLSASVWVGKDGDDLVFGRHAPRPPVGLPCGVLSEADKATISTAVLLALPHLTDEQIDAICEVIATAGNAKPAA